MFGGIVEVAECRKNQKRPYGAAEKAAIWSFLSITIYHKITAAITAVLFLFNILGTDIAWAFKNEGVVSAIGDGMAGKKRLEIDSFQIPATLGTIKHKHKDRRGTIVYIQDAHCNYTAQQSIANIIGHLNETYGIDLVNLEGGDGDYHLSLFTDINDKALREKVSDYFVKEGRVSGAEFFAINNPEKVTLFGIEDANLYIKNLNIYKDSLEYIPDVNNALDYITVKANELKKLTYTDRLIELDEKYNAFKNNRIELKEFIEYIFEKSLNKNISLKGFPNIRLLYNAISKEKHIDFKKANHERDKLIEELKEALSDNAMDKLILKTFLFKADRLSQSAYYNYLKDIAGKYRIDLHNKPNFSNYIIYINYYEEADKLAVFDELEGLFELIVEKEFENESQKILFRTAKNIQILKNIFNIKVTKKEINYFNKHKDEFDISKIIEFIERESLKYNLVFHFDNSARLIDIRRDEILKFYKYALKRDEAFVRNIKKAKRRFRKDTSIVVAGGFHEENLTELFKKNGFSYVVICPTFKNGNGYKCPYYKLLAGGLTDLERKIVAAISTIAPASFLNHLGIKVHGKAAHELFRLAVQIQEGTLSLKEVELDEVTREAVMKLAERLKAQPAAGVEEIKTLMLELAYSVPLTPEREAALEYINDEADEETINMLIDSLLKTKDIAVIFSVFPKMHKDGRRIPKNVRRCIYNITDINFRNTLIKALGDIGGEEALNTLKGWLNVYENNRFLSDVIGQALEIHARKERQQKKAAETEQFQQVLEANPKGRRLLLSPDMWNATCFREALQRKAGILKGVAKELSRKPGDAFTGLVVVGSTYNGSMLRSSDVDLRIICTDKSIAEEAQHVVGLRGIRPCPPPTNADGIERVMIRCDITERSNIKFLFNGLFFGERKKLAEIQRRILADINEDEWNKLLSQIWAHEVNLSKTFKRFGIENPAEKYLIEATRLLHNLPLPYEETKRSLLTGQPTAEPPTAGVDGESGVSPGSAGKVLRAIPYAVGIGYLIQTVSSAGTGARLAQALPRWVSWAGPVAIAAIAAGVIAVLIWKKAAKAKSAAEHPLAEPKTYTNEIPIGALPACLEIIKLGFTVPFKRIGMYDPELLAKSFPSERDYLHKLKKLIDYLLKEANPEGKIEIIDLDRPSGSAKVETVGVGKDLLAEVTRCREEQDIDRLKLVAANTGRLLAKMHLVGIIADDSHPRQYIINAEGNAYRIDLGKVHIYSDEIYQRYRDDYGMPEESLERSHVFHGPLPEEYAMNEIGAILEFRTMVHSDFIIPFVEAYLEEVGDRYPKATAYAREFKAMAEEIERPSQNEIEVVNRRIRALIRGLGYSDDVAQDFIDAIYSWEDVQDILVSCKRRLDRAKAKCAQGGISKRQLAKIEEGIADELNYIIQKEIDFGEEFFDLSEVIKAKKAQCVGYSQLGYILGNAVGLTMGIMETPEVVYDLFSSGQIHIFCIVNLADGKIMIMDLVVPAGFISEPFILEEEYVKVDNYWELKKNRNNPLALHKRIRLLDYQRGLAAAVYYHRGVYSDDDYQAISWCDRAIELDPNCEAAYSNRGAFYSKLGQFEQAISDYTTAIRLNPKKFGAYYNRGIAFSALGHLERAILDYTAAIELNPEFAEVYFNRGNLYLLRLGKFYEAISDFSTVIVLNPKNDAAYNNRGNAYFKLGQMENAISDFSQAIEINERNAAAYFSRGFVYAHLGKDEEAQKDLLKAVELRPDLWLSVMNISDQFGLDLGLHPNVKPAEPPAGPGEGGEGEGRRPSGGAGKFLRAIPYAVGIGWLIQAAALAGAGVRQDAGLLGWALWAMVVLGVGGVLIWLKSNLITAPVKTDYKSVEDIFLPKKVKIRTEVGGKTDGSLKGGVTDFDRNLMQINRDETAVSHHAVDKSPFSERYPQVVGDSGQKDGGAGTAVDIGFGFKRTIRPSHLNIYNRVEFFFIDLVRKLNGFFHKMWVKPSGPGTGKDNGTEPGYFSRAFFTASRPVNIFPSHTTIRWWGYFLTNLSRLSLIKASLFDIFARIVSPFLGSNIHQPPNYNSALLAKSQAISLTLPQRKGLLRLKDAFKGPHHVFMLFFKALGYGFRSIVYGVRKLSSRRTAWDRIPGPLRFVIIMAGFTAIAVLLYSTLSIFGITLPLALRQAQGFAGAGMVWGGVREVDGERGVGKTFGHIYIKIKDLWNSIPKECKLILFCIFAAQMAFNLICTGSSFLAVGVTLITIGVMVVVGIFIIYLYGETGLPENIKREILQKNLRIIQEHREKAKEFLRAKTGETESKPHQIKKQILDMIEKSERIREMSRDKLGPLTLEDEGMFSKMQQEIVAMNVICDLIDAIWPEDRVRRTAEPAVEEPAIAELTIRELAELVNRHTHACGTGSLVLRKILRDRGQDARIMCKLAHKWVETGRLIIDPHSSKNLNIPDTVSNPLAEEAVIVIGEGEDEEYRRFYEGGEEVKVINKKEELLIYDRFIRNVKRSCGTNPADGPDTTELPTLSRGFWYNFFTYRIPVLKNIPVLRHVIGMPVSIVVIALTTLYHELMHAVGDFLSGGGFKAFFRIHPIKGKYSTKKKEGLTDPIYTAMFPYRYEVRCIPALIALTATIGSIFFGTPLLLIAAASVILAITYEKDIKVNLASKDPRSDMKKVRAIQGLRETPGEREMPVRELWTISSGSKDNAQPIPRADLDEIQDDFRQGNEKIYAILDRKIDSAPEGTVLDFYSEIFEEYKELFREIASKWKGIPEFAQLKSEIEQGNFSSAIVMDTLNKAFLRSSRFLTFINQINKTIKKRTIKCLPLLSIYRVLQIDPISRSFFDTTVTAQGIAVAKKDPVPNYLQYRCFKYGKGETLLTASAIPTIQIQGAIPIVYKPLVIRERLDGCYNVRRHLAKTRRLPEWVRTEMIPVNKALKALLRAQWPDIKLGLDPQEFDDYKECFFRHELAHILLSHRTDEHGSYLAEVAYARFHWLRLFDLIISAFIPGMGGSFPHIQEVHHFFGKMLPEIAGLEKTPPGQIRVALWDAIPYIILQEGAFKNKALQELRAIMEEKPPTGMVPPAGRGGAFFTMMKPVLFPEAARILNVARRHKEGGEQRHIDAWDDLIDQFVNLMKYDQPAAKKFLEVLWNMGVQDEEYSGLYDITMEAVRERENQARQPAKPKPEFVAPSDMVRIIESGVGDARKIIQAAEKLHNMEVLFESEDMRTFYLAEVRRELDDEELWREFLQAAGEPLEEVEMVSEKEQETREKIEGVFETARNLRHELNNIYTGLLGTLDVIRLYYTKKEFFEDLRVLLKELIAKLEALPPTDTTMDAADLLRKCNAFRTDLSEWKKELEKNQEAVWNNFETAKAHIPEDEREEIENDMRSEINRLISTIDEYEKGKFLSLEKKLVSLDELNELIEAQLHPAGLSETRDISVNKTFETDGHDIEVELDSFHLGLVFLNIFINARQAGAKAVDVTTKVVDSRFEAEIRDYGTGIAEELLDEAGNILIEDGIPIIFKRGKTTKDKGSGIGLALAREIVEKHNGEINVRPELQGGTTFTITLPVHSTTVVQPEAAETAPIADLTTAEAPASGFVRSDIMAGMIKSGNISGAVKVMLEAEKYIFESEENREEAEKYKKTYLDEVEEELNDEELWKQFLERIEVYRKINWDIAHNTVEHIKAGLIHTNERISNLYSEALLDILNTKEVNTEKGRWLLVRLLTLSKDWSYRRTWNLLAIIDGIKWLSKDVAVQIFAVEEESILQILDRAIETLIIRDRELMSKEDLAEEESAQLARLYSLFAWIYYSLSEWVYFDKELLRKAIALINRAFYNATDLEQKVIILEDRRIMFEANIEQLKKEQPQSEVSLMLTRLYINMTITLVYQGKKEEAKRYYQLAIENIPETIYLIEKVKKEIEESDLPYPKPEETIRETSFVFHVFLAGMYLKAEDFSQVAYNLIAARELAPKMKDRMIKTFFEGIIEEIINRMEDILIPLYNPNNRKEETNRLSIKDLIAEHKLGCARFDPETGDWLDLTQIGSGGTRPEESPETEVSAEAKGMSDGNLLQQVYHEICTKGFPDGLDTALIRVFIPAGQIGLIPVEEEVAEKSRRHKKGENIRKAL